MIILLKVLFALIMLGVIAVTIDVVAEIICESFKK